MLSDFYGYFKKIVGKMEKNECVKKIIGDFFEKHGDEIRRAWLNNYKFCMLHDYNTAQCDEYVVAGEDARMIVQPLYDLVEKIENEIKASLLQLFITLRPMCSNCKYFVPRGDHRIKQYIEEELSHDEGYCILYRRIVSRGDLCEKYESS